MVFGAVQNAMQAPVKIIPPSPVPEKAEGHEQTTRAGPGDRCPGSSEAEEGYIFRRTPEEIWEFEALVT